MEVKEPVFKLLIEPFRYKEDAELVRAVLVSHQCTMETCIDGKHLIHFPAGTYRVEIYPRPPHTVRYILHLPDGAEMLNLEDREGKEQISFDPALLSG